MMNSFRDRGTSFIAPQTAFLLLCGCERFVTPIGAKSTTYFFDWLWFAFELRLGSRV